MRRILLTLLIAISSVLAIQAQGDVTGGATVVRAEYFFDSDPGYGNATIINNVTEGDNELSLSVEDLSPGAHMLYVRSQASSGVWSSTQSHPLLLVRQRPAEAVRVEYFYDTDPGYGNGVSVGNLTDGDNTLVVSVAGLAYGVHHLCLRAQDNTGVWSQVATYSVFVTSPTTANAVRIEYFFDTDPGFGQATPITPSQDEEATYALSLDNLSMGAHMLYLRVQDNHGRWSAVQKHPIYVLSNLPDVVAVEYFFDDNDPGEGLATAVPLPSVKMDPFAFEANIAGLAPGEHHLMVRLQKNNGFWTIFDAATFTIEGPAEPEPYAAFSDNNTVLTFYYDTKKEERSGMGVGPFSPSISGSWGNKTSSITTVVFDESFASYTSLTSTSYWFSQCKKLTTIVGMENLNTSGVTKMDNMFLNCEALTSLDLSSLNTSEVTRMDGMIRGCTSLLEVNLSNFNTEKVESTNSMFYGCHSLKTIDLSSFATPKLSYTGYMFFDCTELTTIYASEEWTVEKVTESSLMFSYCNKLVGGMGTVFSNDYTGKQYARIDGGPSNPGYFTNKNAPAENEPYAVLSDNNTILTFYYDDQKVARGGMSVGPFDNTSERWGGHAVDITSAVFDASFVYCTSITSTAYWFYQCSNLVKIEGLGNLRTDNVTDMRSMFNYCPSLTSLDLSGFNTGNVTSMRFMFHNCSIVPYFDLSSFNTAKVTDMTSMFRSCSSLATIYVGDYWNMGAVTDSQNMFLDCSRLVGGASTIYNASNIDVAYAHIDGGMENPGYMTDKNAVPASNAQAYYVFSNNQTVLTFFYDDKRSVRNGSILGLNSLEYGDIDFGDERWYYSESIKRAVFDVSFAKCPSITNTIGWFYNCKNMTVVVGLENLNTENATNMNSMFYDCSSLTSLDVSRFKTDNVINMGTMFSGCSALTSLDVSNFNTANVKNMQAMFQKCSSLTNIDVSNFRTDNVTNMGNMFYNCSALTSLDVSGFNTANLKDVGGMFYNCSGLTSLDVSNFKTDNVTDMGGMFYHCSSLTTIYAGSGWSTGSVTNSGNMFEGCTKLVGGMGTVFDPDHVDATYAHIDGGPSNPGYFTDKNATPVIAEAYAVLSDDNTILTFYYDDKKVARDGMSVSPFAPGAERSWAGDQSQTTIVFDNSFANCTTITSTADWFSGFQHLETIVGIENLNTQNVTDMQNMFSACTMLTSLDLSHFNTEKVTNMESMFWSCGALTTLDVSSFNTANVTKMNGMFYSCGSLTSLDVSGFNTSKVTDMKLMFGDCFNLTSLDLSHFNTESVTDMSEMFYRCGGLTSLDLSSFNTSNVTNMYYMFYLCKGLTNLDVSGFNTSNVVNMQSMFASCDSLKVLDLSSFNTAKVEYMQNIFHSCTELTTIYADDWVTTSVVDGPGAFYSCYKLVGGAGTTYDENRVDYTYAHIDGGPSNPGYFTDKNAPVITNPEGYAVLSDNNTVLTFYYDDQKEQRNGMGIGPFLGYDARGWHDQRESITNVVFDASFANDTTLTSTAHWFYDCRNLTTITGIGNLRTDNVTDMRYMFRYCTNLTELDVSGFNTENVVSMRGLFSHCSSLTNLDVSGFRTDNVTDMMDMFDDCSKLTSIDVSHFNTEKVTTLSVMFQMCSSLTSLDLSNFNTSNVTNTQGMFYGCSDLVSLNVRTFDMSKVNNAEKNMFIGCSSLASIIAGSANIPAEEYAQIQNPNLLVYVNDASLAPQGVQNVVVNGVAKEIVLTDEVGTYGNNNFLVPQTFTAEKISYTRNFTQHTQPNVSRGWESISLPFSVQNIVHESKGDLSPFGSPAEGKKFWLRRLADNGLTRASQIEANVPYVISMPNSTEYTDLYNLAGRVTFSSQYTTVPATTQQVLALADSSIVMMPTTLRIDRSSDVWAINVGEVRGQYLEGSVFERDYREVRPFEAYTVHRSNGPAPRFVPIIEMDADATGIEDVRGLMSDGRGDQWYDLKGSKLQQKPTQKGVYILNGAKVVIK